MICDKDWEAGSIRLGRPHRLGSADPTDSFIQLRDENSNVT